MPIVIKKGSDLTKKKKCKTKSMTKNASGESLPEVVDYSNIATDMTDVLDFKIYRVIKPNFYNNSTRINLIGDAFYRDEEGELQPDGHLPPEGIEKKDEKKKKVTVPQPKPSVNVRDLGFADILTRIKESERNTATVRSGHSITKFLTAPTLEETIVWAIKFVQANGESLILHVIDLYYQLKSFESNLEGLAKNYRMDRSRTSSEDMSGGRDRAHSGHSEEAIVSRSRGRAESSEAPRDRTRTWSSGEGGGGGGGDSPRSGRAGPRRSSSRLMSSTGVSDALMGAAGERLNAIMQSPTRNKHLSLSMQLDSIKIQGTDSFVKAITPHKESTLVFPHGKRHWKHQSASKHPHLDSTSSLGASSVSSGGASVAGHKQHDGARKASIVKVTAAAAPLVASQQASASAIPSSSGLASSTAAAVLAGSVTVMHPAPPTAPRPSSSSTVGGNPRNSGRSERPVVTLSLAPPVTTVTSTEPVAGAGFEANQSPRAAQGPPSPVGTSSPRPAEAVVSPRAEKKQSPRPQQRGNSSTSSEGLVNHSQRMLASLLKTTTAIQSSIATRIRRAERAGRRVVRMNKDFNDNVERADVQAACLFEGKEFSRPVSLLHQIECYEGHFREDSHSTGNVHKDMRIVQEQAAKKTQELFMERLLRHRWFLALLVKLRVYMKKMNNSVPLCCVQFVVAIQQVLVMDFAFTQAMFYTLLEATVVQKEDHLKTIVHQLLKVAREVLDISAPDFLAYLEERDISAHPELVNQVRALNKAQRQGQGQGPMNALSGSVRLTFSSLALSPPTAASSVPLLFVLTEETSVGGAAKKSAAKVGFAPDVMSHDRSVSPPLPSAAAAAAAVVMQTVPLNPRGSLLVTG